MIPPKRFKYTLTGKTRGRPGWFGKYILQVEKRWASFDTPFSKEELYSGFRWFDATWEDVQALGIRAEARGEK